MNIRFSSLILLLVLFISTNASALEQLDSLSGSVTYSGDPVCAMVLANGEYCFSSADTGSYMIEGVPLAGDGTVTIYAFCENLAPFKQTLTPASSSAGKDIAMIKDSGSPGLDVSVTVVEGSDGSSDVSGFVTKDGEAVTAMILANGKYMFSSGEDGTFILSDVPTDGNNKITFYSFCENFAPFKKTLDLDERNYTYTNVYGQTFQRVPAGTYIMGSPKSEDGRFESEKQHKVVLSNDFYIMTKEVTQGQWKAVIGNNPSHFGSCGDDCPIENVSWSEVQDFIKKMNLLAGEDVFRLPTEAEWEYACRAGTRSATSNGDITTLGLECGNDPTLDPIAWYCDNSPTGVHPVGLKKTNNWGLYDMHGNVLEFVQDWYGAYPNTNVTDPTGPDSGTYITARGGSGASAPVLLRSATRFPLDIAGHYTDTGFRLVRIIDDETSTNKVTYYKDADGDGYSGGISKDAAEKPENYFEASELVSISGDCDDNNSSIHPGAQDVPNDGIDQDCSGTDAGYQDSYETYDGWWYNPQAPGTWITMERTGITLFLLWYVYDENGRPIWYVSWAPQDNEDENKYVGDLVYYTGWEIGEAWKSPNEHIAVRLTHHSQ